MIFNLEWTRRCIVGLLLFAAACSDDGVPAQETSASGSGSEGTVGTTVADPTTQTTSVTVSTTADSTDPADTTDPTQGMTTVDTSGGESGAPIDTDASTSSAATSGTSESTGTSTGDSTTDNSTSSAETDTGGLPVGDPCGSDQQCATGVCWDFADYDPFCGGTACSDNCKSDQQCEQMIADAGGEDPSASFCGKDGRCWMQGTGFGQYFCQGG